MTDRDLIVKARGHVLDPIPHHSYSDLLALLADALEAHQGKPAEEAWVAEARAKYPRPASFIVVPEHYDLVCRLLADRIHLNNLLADAGRSGEYLLGHQAARREVAEMLEREADAVDGSDYRLARGLREAVKAIRALPDPGEPPPWETLVAENARMREALREIVAIPAGGIEERCIARAALEGGTQ